MARFDNILQFKIQLRGIRPPIWRRIQVAETSTFWDLHCAIQDAMGWTDSHLHAFEALNPQTHCIERIGVPDPEAWQALKAGWNQKVRRYFESEGGKATYFYDFGDGWEHLVTLEKTLPRDRGEVYPRCTAGRRACPPEDCGGVWGYHEIISGATEFQEEYAGYDPEDFNPKDVIFESASERRLWMEQGGY